MSRSVRLGKPTPVDNNIIKSLRQIRKDVRERSRIRNNIVQTMAEVGNGNNNQGNN